MMGGTASLFVSNNSGPSGTVRSFSYKVGCWICRHVPSSDLWNDASFVGLLNGGNVRAALLRCCVVATCNTSHVGPETIYSFN